MEFPIRINNNVEKVWINQDTINNSKHLTEYLERGKCFTVQPELNLGGVPYDYFIVMVHLENGANLDTVFNFLKEKNDIPTKILYKLLRYSEFFYFYKISKYIVQCVTNLEKNKICDIDLKTELLFLYLLCDKLKLDKSFRKILLSILNSKRLSDSPFNIKNNIYIGHVCQGECVTSVYEGQFIAQFNEITNNIFIDLKMLNIYVRGEFLYEVLKKHKAESEIYIYIYGADAKETERKLIEYFKTKNFLVCELVDSYKIYKNDFEYIINVNYSRSNKTDEFVLYLDQAIDQIVYIPKTNKCFCTQKFIFLMLTNYEVNISSEIKNKYINNCLTLSEKKIEFITPNKITYTQL